MSDAIQYFLEGFLNQSSKIMDRNQEAGDDLKKRERTAADRNIGVYNKRKGVADAVLSAAKGLKNDGATMEQIKLAISEQGGVSKLRKKLDSARDFWGDDWDPTKAQDYIDLPDEFVGNPLLTDNSITLKDFIYDTYNLTSSKLGDYQMTGEPSWKDNFFGSNAEERAKMALDKESMQGQLSVLDVNKLAALPEFESQIGGSYLGYKNPKFINNEVAATISKDLSEKRRDFLNDNVDTKLAVAALAKKQEGYINSLETSGDSAALRATYNEIIERRTNIENQLKRHLQVTVDKYENMYGEELFGDKMAATFANLYDLGLTVTDPGDITIDDTVIDLTGHVDQFGIKPLDGGTQSDYKWEVARDLRRPDGSGPQLGDIFHVKTIEGQPTIEHIRIVDGQETVLNSITGDAAIEALRDRGMAYDISRQLLSPGGATPPPAEVPVVNPEFASSAAQEALKEHMAQFNLTSTTTTRDNNFYDYQNNTNNNGIISDSKVRSAVLKWARRWNTANPNDKVDISAGASSIDPLKQMILDLLPTTITNPEVVDTGVVDTGVVDTGVVNPEVVNPEVVNPEVVNPEVVDTEVETSSSTTPLGGDREAAQAKALFSRDPDVAGLSTWESDGTFGRLKKTDRNLTTRNTSITRAISRYLKDRDGSTPSREEIEAMAEKYIKALKMGIYD